MAFGKAMCAELGNATHFALVRQINAELTHIPADAIEAWQETGPRRVVRALAGPARRARLPGSRTCGRASDAAHDDRRSQHQGDAAG